jgi:high-affinity iron transporter
VKSIFNITMPHPPRTGAAVVGLILQALFASGALAADAEVVRRLALLVSAAGEEYREALDDAGRIVRPIEIQEAKLLISEARQQATRLEPRLATEFGRRLDGIARGLDENAPRERFAGDVEGLVAWLAEATGVSVEIMPPGPPSPARGRTVFAENCVSCHGETGRGDGPSAATLERKPADFTDPAFMRGETPLDFMHVVSVGKRLGGMPAWGDVLTAAERWDAVSYVWTLHVGEARLAEGRGSFVAQCAGCHGVGGDGHGQYAPALGSPVPALSDLQTMAQRTDAEIFTLIGEGVPGTTMPGFAHLDENARWNLVAFVRSLSLAPPAQVATAPAAQDDAGPALAASRRLVDEAVAAHARRDEQARALATDAYFAFEPVERRLAGVDAAMVGRVEQAFLALRGALGDPDTAAVAARADEVRQGLAAAEAALGQTGSAWAWGFQSATIVVREGVEVVLVIGALLAYVNRSGNAAMSRSIWAGTGVGIVLSVATAVLLATVLSFAPGTGALLEGIAMLSAAVVLFWVSYWIISKAEAERWQRYIQGRVKQAVATGSSYALASAAFLAVYREGFETVLFYQALLAGAENARGAVAVGFVVGCVVLAVVAALFRVLGVRLPIRPFFLVTGALLYFLSIVFVGKGVHELQEAGLVGVTNVSAVPQIDFLGVFPTLETLLAQAVLVACVLYGVMVVLRHSDSGGSAPKPDLHVAGGRGARGTRSA